MVKRTKMTDFEEKFIAQYERSKNIETAINGRKDPRNEVRTKSAELLYHLTNQNHQTPIDVVENLAETERKASDYESAHYFSESIDSIAGKINADSLEGILSNEKIQKAIVPRLDESGRKAYSIFSTINVIGAYAQGSLKDEKQVKAIKESALNAYVSESSKAELHRQKGEKRELIDNDLIKLRTNVAKITFGTLSEKEIAKYALMASLPNYNSEESFEDNVEAMIGESRDKIVSSVRNAYKSLKTASKDDFSAARDLGYALLSQKSG